MRAKLLSLFFLLFLQISKIYAQTYTNGAATGMWNNDANWNTPPFPNAVGASASFNAGATGTITLGQDITVGVLDFVSGTHTIAGANTLSMDNTIAPAIIAAASTTTISANVVFVDSISTVNPGPLALSGAISGAGGIALSSAANVTISGATSNSYTGQTAIADTSALTLNKSGGATAIAGNVDITSSGNVTFLASNQIADTATVTISNTGTFTLNGNSDTISALHLNAPSSITQSGSSLLTLNDALTLNLSTGSVTATLLLANASSITCTSTSTLLTASTITLASGSHTVTVSPAVSCIIDGVVAGGGSFSKTGSGILQLSNASNSFTGGCTIQEGTFRLTGGGTVNGGNIALTGASAVFDISPITTATTIGDLSGVASSTVTLGTKTLVAGTANSTTFAGNMTGGTFTKQGTGDLNLTGTAALTTCTVNAGTLSVNTSAFSGNITVNTAGTLRGLGPITGNVVVNGIMAPGNSIGTTTIIGAYTQAAGSTLQNELSPSATDLLVVTGTVTIAPGATLALLPEIGFYNTGTVYTLITATGGVTGTFSTVTLSLPLFEALVTYNPTNVLLTITTLLDGPIRPTLFKAVTMTQQQNTFNVRKGFSRRMDERLYATCLQYEDTFDFWIDLYGESSFQKSKQRQLSYNVQTGTGIMGFDALVSPNTLIGFGAGYSYSHIHWHQGPQLPVIRQRDSSGHINGVYGALYASWVGRYAFLHMLGMGGWMEADANRNVEIATVNHKASHTNQGAEAEAYLDFGFSLPNDYIELHPFVSADYLYLHENAFTEHKGGPLNLRIAANNSQMVRLETGLQFSRCVNSYSNTVTSSFDASVSWIREVRFEGKDLHASPINSPCCSFVAAGYFPSRSLLGVSAHITGYFREETVSVSLGYDGEFGSDMSDQLGDIHIGWKF